MSRVPRVRDPELAGLLRGLPELPATQLANQAGAVARDVLRRGAAVITKHDQPVMVLMSVEHYAELARGAAPSLDALTRDFEAMYARMQDPEVAARTIAALDLDGRQGHQGSPTTPTDRPTRRKG